MNFLLRANGKVYRKIKKPWAIFCKSLGCLHRIGEKEEMEAVFESMQNRYRAFGFHDEADDIALIELPKDQGEIDKVFGIVDYIGKLYQRTLVH